MTQRPGSTSICRSTVKPHRSYSARAGVLACPVDTVTSRSAWASTCRTSAVPTPRRKARGATTNRSMSTASARTAIPTAPSNPAPSRTPDQLSPAATSESRVSRNAGMADDPISAASTR